MSVWIGLDGGDDHPLPAEHRAEGVLGVLLAEASLACTHMLYEPFGHYAVSVELPRDLDAAEVERLLRSPEQLGGAVAMITDRSEFRAGEEAFIASSLEAAARSRVRSDGRAFRYQGQETLTGTLCKQDLIARSAIESVEALGSTIESESPIVTQDFVRPQLRREELVLVVTPRADGSFQPFEVENPHDCCADHSVLDLAVSRP
jgi:hypothetical protein